MPGPMSGGEGIPEVWRGWVCIPLPPDMGPGIPNPTPVPSADHHNMYGWPAGGTHPTGLLSCSCIHSLYCPPKRGFYPFSVFVEYFCYCNKKLTRDISRNIFRWMSNYWTSKRRDPWQRHQSKTMTRLMESTSTQRECLINKWKFDQIDLDYLL